MNFDLLGAAIRLLVFIPAVGLHEYCHAKFADMAGDMTPRSQGRVTLNPLAHLDPIGTIMMILASATGMGIGWGKPVQVNVGQMKNPKWDHFISVIAGPLSNLGQALIFAIIIRLGLTQFTVEIFGNPRFALEGPAQFFSYFVSMSLLMNLGMFFFNMLPIGPLDGHWLIGTFMLPTYRNAWYKFCRGPGMFILLALVLLPANSVFNPLQFYMDHTMWPTLEFLLGIHKR